MAGTNFAEFNPSAANQETDSAYASDSLRSGGAAVDGVCPSTLFNKLNYQQSTMIAALALALVNKGFSPVDGSPSSTNGLVTPSTAVSNLAAVLANILTTADYASIISNVFAGASYLDSANGYLKLPAALGGIVVQWGTTASFGTGSATATLSGTFPLAFPNACFAMVANSDGLISSGLVYAFITITAKSASGYTAVLSTGGSQIIINAVQAYWIAVGY